MLKFPYSHEKICALLGINYFTIRKFISKCGKIRKLREMLVQYQYKSPVEFQPFGHESTFKRIALNYKELKKSGFFVKTKE